MLKIIQYLIVNGLAVYLAMTVLPGAIIEPLWMILIVVLVFGILNTLLKPVLKILTLPITIVTLGLFLLVINIFIVYLTASIVSGFTVDGWLTALLFSLIVSISSAFLDRLSH